MCLFYLPLFIGPPSYGYLKLHGKERSRNKDLGSHPLGIQLGTSAQKAANPCSCSLMTMKEDHDDDDAD